MTEAGVAVTLEKIHKTFAGGRVVLREFSLRIAHGEFLAVLGPSGCGKSTLLRIIAGLAEPDSGSLLITPQTSFQTAFVFQDAYLLPWRRVIDNAALPLELMGVPQSERYARAREALVQVALGDAEGLFPNQLSGGMKMRVSLARALVTQPKLLLLDEPFAALDEITRFQLDTALRDLWLSRGMTIIFVTHSISEAAFLANRAVVLTRREGGIKLDHNINLPRERNASLRTDLALAEEMKILLNAMEVE